MILQYPKETSVRSTISADERSWRRVRRAEFGVLLKGLAAGNFDQSTAVSVTDQVLDSLSAVEDAVSQFRDTDAAEQLDPIFVSLAPMDVTVRKGNDNPRPAPGTGDGGNGGSNGDGGGNGNGGSNGDGGGNGNGGGNGDDGGLDTTATVEFSVENVGGSTATEGDITFETDLPSATVEPSSVSRLKPDAAKSFTVAFDTDVSGGRYRLQTTVGSAEGAAESVVIPVFVSNKTDYVEETIRQLEGLRENVADTESKASVRPILRTVKEAVSDLERLAEQLRDGSVDSKTANQTLFGVKQRLGRIEGLLSSLRGLSESRRAALLTEVSEITDLIADARGAQI